MKKKFIWWCIVVMIIFITGLFAIQKANLFNKVSDEEVSKLSYEEFYELISSKERSMVTFDGIPEQLAPIVHMYKGVVFTTAQDTVELINSFPDLTDKKNRYPFYFLKDNHGNYWTLFQEDTNVFRLYQQDSTDVQDIIEQEQSTLYDLIANQ